MRLRRWVLMGVSVMAVTGCAELFPKPHPDATGVVVVSCMAYTQFHQLEACDQRAVEACDGPALELSSTSSPVFSAEKEQSIDQTNVVARYQCTPR